MSDTEIAPDQQDSVSKDRHQKVQLGPKTVELPAEWDIGKIGDNTYLKGRIGWHGLTEEDHMEEGEFFLVTGTDFENGRVNWEDCVYVNEEWYERDENIQLEKNDILLTKDGSIGKTALVKDLPNEATLNNGIFLIRPLEEAYLPQFMYYILNSKYMDDFIESITAGSTISHLYQKDFINFRFPLPPLPEQRRIASVLSTLDTEIRQTEEIIEITVELKRGFVQDFFTIGEEREQKVLLGPIETSLPSHWNVKPIGEICEDRKLGTDERGDDRNGQKVPLIKMGDLGIGTLNISDTEMVTATSEMLEKYKLKPGDLLFNTRNSPELVGKTAIWNKNQEAIFDNNLLRLRFDDEIQDSRYVNSYLSSSLGRRQTRSKVHGTTSVAAVYWKELEKLKIPIPPKNEREKYIEIISKIREKFSLEQRSLKKLNELKRGLMQDLLTGEVRTTPDLLD